MHLETWQQAIIIIFALYSLGAFVQAVMKINKKKKNVYGLTPVYYFLGSFVWGDALIFGIFWFISSVVIFFLSDWILFWLFFFLFWTIRSVGETIYWFNHQFTTLEKNILKDMPGYGWIRSDALWFIYQVIAQCISVVSALMTLYLGAIWLKQVL